MSPSLEKREIKQRNVRYFEVFNVFYVNTLLILATVNVPWKRF